MLGVTAGFIPPTDGQILVDGRDLVGIPPFQRNIGMVFQNCSLFPHMTASPRTSAFLRMRKLGRAEADERIKRMLGVVRLGGMADRYPAQLSGGQQQRVALARAAVYDPVLLLMDELLQRWTEPARGDAARSRAPGEALGTTVIYVTHDQYEASSMSHRIAIMNGRPGGANQQPRGSSMRIRATASSRASWARPISSRSAATSPPPATGPWSETGQGLPHPCRRARRRRKGLRAFACGPNGSVPVRRSRQPRTS